MQWRLGAARDLLACGSIVDKPRLRRFRLRPNFLKFGARNPVAMQYWLLKTEPETFSYDDLLREGQSHWDGVRNYAARNNLKAMKKGDLAIWAATRFSMRLFQSR